MICTDTDYYVNTWSTIKKEKKKKKQTIICTKIDNIIIADDIIIFITVIHFFFSQTNLAFKPNLVFIDTFDTFCRSFFYIFTFRIFIFHGIWFFIKSSKFLMRFNFLFLKISSLQMFLLCLILHEFFYYLLTVKIVIC